MISKPLRINGSLRRRQTLIVMSPFMKLDLLQRSFRQVQGVGYDETFSLKGHAVPPCVVLVIDDILYGLMVALGYI